jgi:hypothetical protein
MCMCMYVCVCMCVCVCGVVRRGLGAQDLPNHMQMMVPIFSLPQEWLWCETWCSDATLARAKTIDLVCAL